MTELTVGFRAAAVPTSLAPPDMMFLDLQIGSAKVLPSPEVLHARDTNMQPRDYIAVTTVQYWEGLLPWRWYWRRSNSMCKCCPTISEDEWLLR